VAVRTKLLAAGRRTDSTLATVYTVPAGETAIVKEVTVTNLSGSASALVTIALDAGAFDNTLWMEFVIAPRVFRRESMWMVVPAGATIGVQGPGTPNINFWISGTELEGVAD